MAKRKWTNDEVKEFREKQGVFLYYNKEDSNIFVPKVFGIGWTLNWANPISWVFTLVPIVLIVFRIFRLI